MSAPRVHRFRHGTATAVLVDGGAALVVAGADDPCAIELERGLVAGASFADLVGALSLIGFTALPSFALVLVDDDGVHLLQRGAVAIELVRDDGATDVRPAVTVTTWREDVVTDVATVGLRSVDGVPGAEGWLVAGRVAAASVAWLVRGDGSLPTGPIEAAIPAGVVAPRPEAAPGAFAEPMIGELVEVPVATLGGVVIEPPAATAEPPSGDQLVVGSEGLEAVVVAPVAVEPLAVESVVVESVVVEPLAVEPVVVEPVVVEPVVVEPVPADAGASPETADLDFRLLIDDPDEVADPATPDGPVADVPSADDVDAQESPADDQNGMTFAPDRTLVYGAPSTPPLPAPIAGVPVPAGAVDDPDHDGHTVARRAPRSAPRPGSPQIQAVRCPAGHPNRVGAISCRRCGQLVGPATPEPIERPVLGVLRFSTNDEARLDRSVVIGRVPREPALVDGETATSIVIENTELSREHATVRVSGWSVFVTDDDSTNGTSVVTPNRAHEVCVPRQPKEIEIGSVVNLGGVVTFRFDAE